MKGLRVFCLVVSLLAASSPLSAATAVFEAAGANADAIKAQVDAFRAALGSNNGVGNPASGGRREINWDAIPAQFLDPFPGGFFNANSARGAVFSTPGTRMKVSGDTGSASFLMRDVTAQEWGLTELSSFSPERFFAPIGSIITDVEFFVPGTQTRATVRGFGAVFTDIDVANATRIEARDAAGRLLFSQVVQKSPVASKGLSFLGFVLDGAERAARVRIINGTHPIDSPFQSPPPDGVGIDDVIYGEPEALANALAQTTWIASAIRGAGANSTQWRSDLAIVNPTGFAAAYTIDLLLGATTKSRSGTLSSGQQIVLTDVVGELAGGDGIGVIRVTSDQAVNVTESVYNIGGPQGGRFGLSIIGRTADDMLRAGDVAILPHLQQDATTRTNFGMTNTGTAPATVNVTLFADSGAALASYDVTLAPGENRQENGVFSVRAQRNDITFGSARVVVKFGDGIIAYASAVDNVTGDSRLVEMQRLR
jgi:hypothetical protein